MFVKGGALNHVSLVPCGAKLFLSNIFKTGLGKIWPASWIWPAAAPTALCLGQALLLPLEVAHTAPAPASVHSFLAGLLSVWLQLPRCCLAPPASSRAGVPHIGAGLSRPPHPTRTPGSVQQTQEDELLELGRTEQHPDGCSHTGKFMHWPG